MSEAADKFHKHLDECRQCREHPFGLCQVGHGLLMATGGFKSKEE